MVEVYIKDKDGEVRFIEAEFLDHEHDPVCYLTLYNKEKKVIASFKDFISFSVKEKED